MSNTNTTSNPDQTSARPQQPRVLACVTCQQRKIKCDRRFPCAHCTKTGSQCIPAALIQKPRRKRFAERELLDKIRHYEDLLRENDIAFEPIHGREALSRTTTQLRGTVRVKQEPVSHEPRDVFAVINGHSPTSRPDSDSPNGTEPDDGTDVINEAMMKTTLDDIYPHDDPLVFGERIADIDLAALHPGSTQIFKLWQIYQENVDPLLKVTHGPSMQARIVDAIGELSTIDSTLEALLFSIYCMAVISLDELACFAAFGASQADLLRGYQFGCQQALLKCGVFKSSDREGLTALFLYLISARPDTDPRTLFLMLGMAVRLAQRIGIHDESSNIKCNVLEAEMRRRLWWALVIFDNRISEMSASKTTMLLPLWDCKIPSNVGDIELREDMRTAPPERATPTEAWFVVVRAEIDDYLRNCSHQLDFINPALKAIARDVRHSPDPGLSEVTDLTTYIEDKFLKHCNPENPFQLMTLCFARDHLVKERLLEHFITAMGTPPILPSETQGTAIIQLALQILDLDTTLMASPLTKGYHWMLRYHFPFPAYIRIVQDLKRQPEHPLADRCWKAMDANYQARFVRSQEAGIILKLISKSLLEAWRARVQASRVSGEGWVVPEFVRDVQVQVERWSLLSNRANAQGPNGGGFLAQYGGNATMAPSFGPLVGGVGGNGNGDGNGAGGTHGPWSADPTAGFHLHPPSTNTTTTTSKGGFAESLVSMIEIEQIDWEAIDWNEMERSW
ncbi:hypothetical protein LTR62_007584 [Meristemomyces frigidus]|uniref:Zn(2)-C6 fungal-type domain-containing protein n=1 Tax=Meristemomyces frigidus TaxID=1508187 RepID=A0AAN7TBQ6_9PEZI|nr:hypothetical protein LTR62_007584 [Meristemomyces frigidus]